MAVRAVRERASVSFRLNLAQQSGHFPSKNRSLLEGGLNGLSTTGTDSVDVHCDLSQFLSLHRAKLPDNIHAASATNNLTVLVSSL